MTHPLLDLNLRASHAVELAALADEQQQAADESHGTPEAAAHSHQDAVKALRDVAERFSHLADAHEFMARRMSYEDKRERATGIEYRRGDAA